MYVFHADQRVRCCRFDLHFGYLRWIHILQYIILPYRYSLSVKKIQSHEIIVVLICSEFQSINAWQENRFWRFFQNDAQATAKWFQYTRGMYSSTVYYDDTLCTIYVYSIRSRRSWQWRKPNGQGSNSVLIWLTRLTFKRNDNYLSRREWLVTINLYISCTETSYFFI